MPSPSKQNKRVLCSQALKVGRSLGVNSNMEKFTFDSDVWGNHVCKDVWKPAIGEILHAQQELDNAVNKFAVKVVKNNETVDHLLCVLTNVDVFNCTWWKELQTAVRWNMEIPCRLVFSSSAKVKINRLKELMKSKSRR